MTDLLLTEATRLIERATAEGLTLRLIGGISVQLRSPSAQHRDLSRVCGDIDFCAPRRDLPHLEDFFGAVGYEPWLPFNRLNAESSQRFEHPGSGTSIDVFLDRLQMCHVLDFRSRLTLDQATLPLADLLLTKLQIVELNKKDVQDVLALVRDHEVSAGGGADEIDLDRIVSVCSADWGWYRTLIASLGHCHAAVEQLLGTEPLVSGRLSRIKEALEAAPKSRRWKLRASIGDRKRWYDLPETPDRAA